ncbi:adenosylcobinamide amidohydrolase [Scopulibacillus cellulosilyticus]|uniref:Adenosylcobinamide amidohydrolase n=1 Tax=Scopulibacillus cellulosilyticus TaxID=2665665 RepID=A0ABW2PX38_9BACL
MISSSLLQVTSERILLDSPIQLRTLSSAVIGGGTGFYRTFVNRHVNKNYCCDNPKKELRDYLVKQGLDPADTLAMMTAARLEDAAYMDINEQDFSVLIAVTAGLSNAVDAAHSKAHQVQPMSGTINTWVFVNARLDDQAYTQAIVTATEAKVRALDHLNIKDPVTNTRASGTSTDSVLVAASQQGCYLPYAGTITLLGKAIASGVYQCTVKAIQNYQCRISHD